ncbi:MAG TPA: hypothetical protein VJN18_35650 [Polyangiaceae bacterium]|nr:hypothetical protein [Polyangiaceae bacterium]
MTKPIPHYRVDFGRAGHAIIHDWAATLQFAKDRKEHHGDVQRVSNPDKVDGAEDASARAQCGLTREEWAEIEEAGLV